MPAKDTGGVVNHNLWQATPCQLVLTRTASIVVCVGGLHVMGRGFVSERRFYFSPWAWNPTLNNPAFKVTAGNCCTGASSLHGPSARGWQAASSMLLFLGRCGSSKTTLPLGGIA